MIDEEPTTLLIRLATPEDIPVIEELDRLGTSPTRDIHRDMEKYFGSVDPSTHEHTLIFLAELDSKVVGKAELMIPPDPPAHATGYIKRVVVHPDLRGRGLAEKLLQHCINFAASTLKLGTIDLHVWDGNRPAIKLYEKLGFQLQHRELYYRLELQ